MQPLQSLVEAALLIVARHHLSAEIINPEGVALL